MPIIHIEISSDTERDLHDLTALHPKLSISQVAGQLLDVHVAERPSEDTTMSDVILVESKKERDARLLINGLLGHDLADGWPAGDVFEYLEADDYEWNSVEWIITGRSPWTGFDDIGLVPALT